MCKYMSLVSAMSYLISVVMYYHVISIFHAEIIVVHNVCLMNYNFNVNQTKYVMLYPYKFV